jgi:decaprenylphospho-beta-D-ribofuranose 2-oxidase
MSVTELPARETSTVPERSLCGWGRIAPSRAQVHHAHEPERVQELLAAAARRGVGAIARGAGCSYGDAAQSSGGIVIDTSTAKRVVAIDPVARTVTAEPGATIAELLSRLAAHGLTLPVLPGTRHVTLAGALASDIHGKNHHRDGAIARHVVSLTLCTPGLGTVRLTPENDPELLYATLGGMGLTGVILEATLGVVELPSPWVSADLDRTDDLAGTLALLSGEERHRYSVAWLDMLTGGSGYGRAVVSRADPLPAADAPLSGRVARSAAPYPQALLRSPLVGVPEGFPGGLLRPAAVRAFNELYWRASRRQEREKPLALAPYFFPLDVVGAWNRLYGRGGLIQHQFVIPAGEEEALERSFALMRARRLPVYLAVFKRFGAAFGGPLSFPLEGWTLAIDVPGGVAGVSETLEELDELVAGCGGRVYLTKDSRMRADVVGMMYPRLEAFHEQRRRADPGGVLRSDLARRLRLCEEAGA